MQINIDFDSFKDNSEKYRIKINELIIQILSCIEKYISLINYNSLHYNIYCRDQLFWRLKIKIQNFSVYLSRWVSSNNKYKTYVTLKYKKHILFKIHYDVYNSDVIILKLNIHKLHEVKIFMDILTSEIEGIGGALEC